MPERILAVAVLVVLAGWFLVRGVLPRGAPAACPCAEAAVWMADCLPGVGVVRRDAVCAAVRRGDVSSLSPSAQAIARQVFTDRVP